MLAATLQRKFDTIWPSANDTRLAPSLTIRAANAGSLPACASFSPLFYVHLAGLYRSLPEHMRNLRDFIDGSASCWFVVVFVPELVTRGLGHRHHHGASRPADPANAGDLANEKHGHVAVADSDLRT